MHTTSPLAEVTQQLHKNTNRSKADEDEMCFVIVEMDRDVLSSSNLRSFLERACCHAVWFVMIAVFRTDGLIFLNRFPTVIFTRSFERFSCPPAQCRLGRSRLCETCRSRVSHMTSAHHLQDLVTLYKEFLHQLEVMSAFNSFHFSSILLWSFEQWAWSLQLYRHLDINLLKM